MSLHAGKPMNLQYLKEFCQFRCSGQKRESRSFEIMLGRLLCVNIKYYNYILQKSYLNINKVLNKNYTSIQIMQGVCKPLSKIVIVWIKYACWIGKRFRVPEQCGREPLHWPSSWHMRVVLPTMVRWPMQLKRITEPTVRLSPEICAYGGMLGRSHRTTAAHRKTGKPYLQCTMSDHMYKQIRVR